MEVYGEKPKLFSEKWWENYFYYYKVHTIVAICAILALGYITYSDVTSTKYDLKIDYISELGILTEQTEYIEQLAREHIDDVTGNDICDAFVLTIDMAQKNDMQYAQAMQVKYMTEQAYSESFVFIASKEYANNMSGCGIFEPAALWSGTEAEGEFVSLAGCKALADTGMPLDDLYVAVRKLREDETEKEKILAEYQNGIKFAKYLIDER